MNNNLTEIIFIIDKSGSMYDLATDTVGGYNSFIATQKQVEGDAKLTTVLFSTDRTVLHSGVNLKEAELLTMEQYQPSGCTALYDAIGYTIKAVNATLEGTEEEKRPGKVVVCITTDGAENSSTTYTQADIKELIQEQQTKHNWEFIFLGANIDAQDVGNSVGIRHAFNYSANEKGTASLYSSCAQSIATYREEEELDLSSFDNLV